MTRTSSPILWYGDFVDFGSFENVVSDNSKDSTISLNFSIDDVNIPSAPDFQFGIYYRPERELIGPVDVDINISAYEGRTVLSSFVIRIVPDRTTFEAKLGNTGELQKLLLNDDNVIEYFRDTRISLQLGSLFPDIYIRPTDIAKLPSFHYPAHLPLIAPMAALLRPRLHARISTQMLERIAYELLDIPEFSSEELIRLKNRTQVKSFKRLLDEIINRDRKSGLRENIQKVWSVNRFGRISSAVFQKLRSLLSTTLYIGPVRARSERYYRYQDLAVSEIDPDGKNFPMFLNSLTARQRANFSAWVERRFGYGVKVSETEGHISISLTDGGATRNIVDTGYGVSQVLPVLGQIWWASSGQPRRSGPQMRSKDTIIAIEQPELHLHPAHQALLADAIVGEQRDQEAGDRGGKLQFIIETHSEALVNRLGALIASGNIAASDVQVLIFEADRDDSFQTNVRVSNFADDGSLVNWPYGFFQPLV